jgi:acetyl esterase/lipase
MTTEAAQSLAEDMRVSGAAGDGQQAVRVVRQSAKKWNLRPDRIGMMGFSAGAIITNGVCAANDPECRPDFAAPIYGPDTAFDLVGSNVDAGSVFGFSLLFSAYGPLAASTQKGFPVVSMGVLLDPSVNRLV